MVFRADQVKVFGLGTFLPFADVPCVFGTQPCLEEISLGFLGITVVVPLGKGHQPMLDFLVGLGPLGRIGDAGQQVALEHVSVAQRKATVIHGLEDGVRIGIGVSRDFHQMHFFQQPIDKIRQRLGAGYVLRESIANIVEAPNQVVDRFGLVGGVIALAIKQGLHAVIAFRHIQVEGLGAKLLGEDQFFNGFRIVAVFLLAV